jgi:hypothetical protein
LYYYLKLLIKKYLIKMKKILILIALFASFSTMATAQTGTKKAVKTSQVKKTKKAKVAATTTSTIVAAPIAVIAPAAAGAVATFEKIELDYGKIKKGSEPLRVFNFKNTGSEPLIISNAQGSCGCTVPTFPKEPIMPGQSSKIEVRYDTQRPGAFSKTVTLTTNEANPSRTLTIKGEVEAEPTPAIEGPKQ